jgi:hypothetical protein
MTTRAQHCYLCCEPLNARPELGAATIEHFIPRCFYEGRQVANEPDLSLPAHLECNRSTSLDEEWVFIHFALTSPIGSGPSGPRSGERQQRAIRALTRPTPRRPEGLAKRFEEGALALPSGDFRAVYIGADRLTWVLAKLAKGLTFRASGALLPPETVWTTRYCDYGELIQDTFSPWVVEVPREGPTRGEVLIAKGFSTAEYVAWRMVILGALPAAITTMTPPILANEKAAGRVRGWDDEDEHDFMQLRWPKPRATGGT